MNVCVVSRPIILSSWSLSGYFTAGSAVDSRRQASLFKSSWKALILISSGTSTGHPSSHNKGCWETRAHHNIPQIIDMFRRRALKVWLCDREQHSNSAARHNLNGGLTHWTKTLSERASRLRRLRSCLLTPSHRQLAGTPEHRLSLYMPLWLIQKIQFNLNWYNTIKISNIYLIICLNK